MVENFSQEFEILKIFKIEIFQKILRPPDFSGGRKFFEIIFKI